MLIMNAVYRADVVLLAIVPTQADAERFLMPSTYEEFRGYMKQAAEYGWRWTIKRVRVMIKDEDD